MLAEAIQFQHRADVDAIVLAAIDRDHLVLAGLRNAAIDRYDARVDRLLRRMRHVVEDRRGGTGSRRSPTPISSLERDHGEACASLSAWRRALQLQRAEVGRLVADHLAGRRIVQRLAWRKPGTTCRPSSRRARRPCRLAEIDAAFLRRHDARRVSSSSSSTISGCDRKGSISGRNRRDRLAAQAFGAHLRRQAHGPCAVARRLCRRPACQPQTAGGAVEIDDWPG